MKMKDTYVTYRIVQLIAPQPNHLAFYAMEDGTLEAEKVEYVALAFEERRECKTTVLVETGGPYLYPVVLGDGYYEIAEECHNFIGTGESSAESRQHWEACAKRWAETERIVRERIATKQGTNP